MGDFGWSVKLVGATSLVGGKNSKIEQVNATWAAPEVLNGEEFTEKIDIYAFGIMLWELLVQCHPFSLDLEVGLMQVLKGYILKKGRPSIPPSLFQRENEKNPEMFSKYLDLMNRCWDHQPSSRPTAFQVCESLREMMQGEASLLGKIVDEEGILDRLRKVHENTIIENSGHYSISHQSLSLTNLRVSDLVEPHLKDEKWQVKRVLFAGLDWVWIGFWNGYVGVVDVKKAIAGDSGEFILCHEADKHQKEVRAMVYQSVGGHVWTSSMCGTLRVWKDAPLGCEEAVGLFNIKGWLRDVSSLSNHEDVWVSLDTGRLRIFTHQYFGAEDDSIQMNKNTIIEYHHHNHHHQYHHPHLHHPVIHISCPERKKTFKLTTAIGEEKKRFSPSLSHWWGALEQFSRMMSSSDLSLLCLCALHPENNSQSDVDSTHSEKEPIFTLEIGFLGLEVVGHSVWGYTALFEVVEFTLVTVEDEHGLYRTSRVEAKRRLKLDQSPIDVRFHNIGRSGLVSMGMSTLCVAIGNAVGGDPHPGWNGQLEC